MLSDFHSLISDALSGATVSTDAWAAAVASRVNNSTIFAGANLYRSLGLSPSVYPQAGLPYGVHLTDVGSLAGGDAWADALIEAGF